MGGGSPFDRVIERRGTASFKWDRYPCDVVPLWVADMDFAAPPPVVEALRRRVEHGVFGYADPPDSLIQSIQTHLRRRYGWRIEADWLVWLPGIVPGLALCCAAFAGPGEAVLTLTPAYPPFLEAPAHQGRRLITVDSFVQDGRWALPLEAMEAAVTPDTRVFLWCHPHNPLGRVWSREETAAVVRFCRRHHLVLCSDEIHCDLVLDDLAHVPAALAHPEAGARTVTLMAPSKTFNLPGLGFGFAVVPDPELRRRFRRPGRGLLEYPGCLAVTAAEAAYRDGGPWLEALLAYLRGNRDLVERFVARSLPRVRTTRVEATYLAWLDARAAGVRDPAQACLQAGVALSDGAHFGAPGCLRLNFGCPRATLEEGLRRLERALGGA